MKRIIGTMTDIARIVGGRPRGRITDTALDAVSIDSRHIPEGALFFAIAGERTDGHLYLEEAFQKGAAAAVVQTGSSHLDRLPDGSSWIEVEDTLEALQVLAAHVRTLYPIPVIGVTGSSGKTTTKDLIRGVLSTRRNVLASEGSFNNEIGLPLTIFALDTAVDVLVVEMGMRGLGQIDALCRIARPDIGVITNVGVTHMELLGSAENIFLAKGELVDFIGSQGHCVLNAQDRWTPRMKSRCRGQIHLYGFSAEAVLRAEDIRYNGKQSLFTMVHGPDRVTVTLPYPGEHHVLDALAAAACGRILGISLEDCARGLQQARLSGNRMHFLPGLSGATVINDCYNANPDSTRASLEVLASQQGRPSAVLGDMRELGALQVDEHRKIGRLAAQLGLTFLATVGPMARDIRTGALEAGMAKEHTASFDSNEAAARWMAERTGSGDVILIKGSRAVGMEQIVEMLTKEEPTT